MFTNVRYCTILRVALHRSFAALPGALFELGLGLHDRLMELRICSFPVSSGGALGPAGLLSVSYD